MQYWQVLLFSGLIGALLCGFAFYKPIHLRE
jgi:hypothetical protein